MRVAVTGASGYIGRFVVKELLDRGHEVIAVDLHYKEVDSNPRYAQLEAEAKLAGMGLWCDDRAVPPWEWRRMSKYERDAYRN